MEVWIERLVAVLIAFLGPLLTIFDLPGNTLLLLGGLGFAFLDDAMYYQAGRKL